MADDLSQRPIVIKRIKKVAGGHHGGAWKIAYADFVTAMMAFFLLMWLLGSSSKAKLEGISDYFKTPLKVALTGGSAVANSDSVLKGGGEDFTRQAGQVKKGVVKEEKIDEKTKKILRERAERIRLEGLKKRIEEAIEANPMLKKFEKQLLLDITTDGLRIQIVDEQNRPMFALGKAELQPYTKTILREIGKMLNDVPNKISLSGHTDGKPFPAGDKGFSNWELSADRANASRRELVLGGMDPDKMLKVVGLSSAVLFDKNDALNPINRRISIVVMNEKAVKAVTMEESETVEVDMQDKSPNPELLKPAS
ncbi:MAG TPA: flagellar motor protein MotB [Nitrosomonas sp.]|nr:flagellar motor protein MotB [Nitrosomonas sp.]HQX12873.1 flagellar motor protein MotB [Nitrosomonas sp.]HRB21234.1 flagellar motor protein MotB [Nitrosomonas sp.]HRB33708.1 flagellar motor protein MotB [Nitrosomonas sp.]HRB46627.1 flagellar motor protein MotB [Nitrosomonas sp.]